MEVQIFDPYNLIASLIFIVILQLALFLIAFYFKTDKLTDLAYGMTFVLLAVYLAVANQAAAGQLILLLMVVGWGLRLSGYLFIRINKIGKDNRFNEMRPSFVKFGLFWLLQAVTIWVVSLPFIVALSSDGPSSAPGIAEMAGLVIWLTGLVIETVADAQKFRFKLQPQNKDRWIDVGLWKLARHPNYFGEMLVWWGIFIFTLPYLSGLTFLVILSPVFISFMLRFVSGVPLLEKKYDARFADDPEYAEYKASTNLLVPVRL